MPVTLDMTYIRRKLDVLKQCKMCVSVAKLTSYLSRDFDHKPVGQSESSYEEQ